MSDNPIYLATKEDRDIIALIDLFSKLVLTDTDPEIDPIGNQEESGSNNGMVESDEDESLDVQQQWTSTECVQLMLEDPNDLLRKRTIKEFNINCKSGNGAYFLFHTKKMVAAVGMDIVRSTFVKNFHSMSRIILFQDTAVINKLFDELNEEFGKNIRKINRNFIKRKVYTIVRGQPTRSYNFNSRAICGFHCNSLLVHMNHILFNDMERIRWIQTKDKNLAIEYFYIAYRPLNSMKLFFQRNIRNKYDLLFKLTCWAKYLLDELKNVTIESAASLTYVICRDAYSARMKMIQFFELLMHQILYEAYKIGIDKLMNDTIKAKTPLQLVTCHNEFIDNCIIKCMLDEVDIFCLLIDVFNDSHNFVMFLLDFAHGFIEPTNFPESAWALRMNFNSHVGALVRKAKLLDEIHHTKHFDKFIENLKVHVLNRLF